MLPETKPRDGFCARFIPDHRTSEQTPAFRVEMCCQAGVRAFVHAIDECFRAVIDKSHKPLQRRELTGNILQSLTTTLIVRSKNDSAGRRSGVVSVSGPRAGYGGRTLPGVSFEHRKIAAIGASGSIYGALPGKGAHVIAESGHAQFCGQLLGES